MHFALFPTACQRLLMSVAVEAVVHHDALLCKSPLKSNARDPKLEQLSLLTSLGIEVGVGCNGSFLHSYPYSRTHITPPPPPP